MHALPRRHPEGGDADAAADLEPGTARRALAGDARRLDLRPRPSGVEPFDLRDALLPGGIHDEGSRGMSNGISFELNGEIVEATFGETIWQVAQRLGTEIPHLCYSPAPDYRADGNCRACMVEIEGERVLA